MKQRFTFTISTLGCKVNQFESEAIIKALRQQGLEVREPGSKIKVPPGAETSPDISIINTCTVTGKAAMQSRQAIRQAIRANPRARIIVTGCYAQTKPEEIAAIKGVHKIVGHNQKGRIPEVVCSLGKYDDRKTPEIIRSDIDGDEIFAEMPAMPIGTRTRSFLKIQDGCSAFCTYCIVPHARGKSRSMVEDGVIEKLRELKCAGRREAVLTGIHLGAYGKDFTPQKSLFQLLSRIRQENLISRVRLSSIEPRELTDDIIDLAAQWNSLCQHFHIPLQSGDDTILRRMNRPYDRKFFRNLVFKIKKHLPDAAVGVDVLAGFPGENDRAFENTYKLLESLPISYLHVFPFSARQGTPAYQFPGKVPSKTINERCRIFRKLGDSLRYRFYSSFIGEKMEVLVEEKRERASGMLKGSSNNYVPVLFEGKDNLKNKLVWLEIRKVSSRNVVLGEF